MIALNPSLCPVAVEAQSDYYLLSKLDEIENVIDRSLNEIKSDVDKIRHDVRLIKMGQ